MTFVENRPGRVRQHVAVGRIVVVGTDNPPCLRRTDVQDVSVRFRKHAVGVDGRGRRKRVKHVHRCVQVCKNVTEDDAAHSGADAVVENPRAVIAAVPESGLRWTARGSSSLGEVGDSAVGVAAAIREIFDLAESQPVGCVACGHADADGPVGGHAVAVARERPLAAVRPSGLVAARVDDRPCRGRHVVARRRRRGVRGVVVVRAVDRPRLRRAPALVDNDAVSADGMRRAVRERIDDAELSPAFVPCRERARLGIGVIRAVVKRLRRHAVTAAARVVPVAAVRCSRERLVRGDDAVAGIDCDRLRDVACTVAVAHADVASESAAV